MRFVNSIILTHRNDQNATGSCIDANQLVSASFQVIPGKNDVAGTLKIQASNDLNTADSGAPAPVNWTDVTSASATITSGGSALIVVNPMGYRWIRAIFTYSSGGSISTNITVQMFAQSV